MIYHRTDELGTSSPNGPRTTWVNSLMSDSQYSVLNTPSKTVAVFICKRELITDLPLHEVLMTIYPNPHAFFNVVGRIACAIAETNPRTHEDVNTELNFTIRMMVGYATDTLALSLEDTLDEDRKLDCNRQHVVQCARNLARVMPAGVWSDFKFQTEHVDSIIFVGTHHAADYR